MQLGSRFAEYGLTGGFFWMCQLLVIATTTQTGTWQMFAQAPFVLPPGTSSPFATVFTSLLGALAIVAVFVAGLLLDLLAAYFTNLEISVFLRHLARNRSWLDPLVAEHGQYCQGDYDALAVLRDQSLSTSEQFRVGFAGFAVWNEVKRRKFSQALSNSFAQWRLIEPYQRFLSFLSSYVVVRSESKLDVMTDQYYLWRAGRSVSVALVILYIEILIIAANRSFAAIGLWASLLAVVLPLALSCFAIAITLTTYSRLCYTLFSLAYVTRIKNLD